MRQKLLVVVGPTASGKSELAVKLAERLNGEVVSADSRQVYKGLEVGSGQMSKKEMRGIPHHLLSFISPKRRYAVAEYQKAARKSIRGIQKRGKLPILVGGSSLYVYSVVDGWVIPEVKPNAKLRLKLNQLSVEKLFQKLRKIDPQRAKTIEQKNKRRLIRALEIVLSTRKPVPQLQKKLLPYPVLFLGINRPKKNLQARIKKRFLLMLQRGFLNEVKELRKQGLSWKRIEGFGLEYREGSLYLQGKITRKAMIDKTVKATQDLARRQMTWFKKDPRIRWVRTSKEAQNLISLSFQEIL